MKKLLGVIPHPAFDTSLLPQEPTKKKVKDDRAEEHYPTGYLESITPPDTQLDAGRDVVGYYLSYGVFALSELLALFWPSWILDSSKLNLWAFLCRPKEVIFLRRALILTGLAWTHADAAALAHHIHGTLINHSNLETVIPMKNEFMSHKTHYNTFAEALQPTMPTRLSLLALQAISLYFYFWTYLICPPLAHSSARYFCSLAVRLYTDALLTLDKGDMTVLQDLPIPYTATWFYSLAPGATFRDVILNIRADDLFHAMFNEICAETYGNKPVTKMAEYMGKPMKEQ